jgi:hypothetical protein
MEFDMESESDIGIGYQHWTCYYTLHTLESPVRLGRSNMEHYWIAFVILEELWSSDEYAPFEMPIVSHNSKHLVVTGLRWIDARF